MLLMHAHHPNLPNTTGHDTVMKYTLHLPLTSVMEEDKHISEP
jgi:hypothetical protein